MILIPYDTNFTGDRIANHGKQRPGNSQKAVMAQAVVRDGAYSARNFSLNRLFQNCCQRPTY